jgi:hypothetical protein
MMVNRSAFTPFNLRYEATSKALCSERVWLYATLPLLSVCPCTSMLVSGYDSSTVTSLFRLVFALSDSTDWSKPKSTLAAEFYYDSLANAYHISVWNLLLDFFGLLVHLVANYCSCSTPNGSSDNCP